jgi:hypothetical protein
MISPRTAISGAPHQDGTARRFYDDHTPAGAFAFDGKNQTMGPCRAGDFG